jgi:Ni/Fe-hydrogenase subunit HybB-like protein
MVSAMGRGDAPWLTVAGIPLALMTAVYTAYLFAQSKGRDLWQSALLPAHMLVQSLVAGSGTLLASRTLTGIPAAPLAWILAVACGTHLLLVWGETTLPHVTAHARLAIHEMVRGRFARWFWVGAVLIAFALASPWVGAVAAPLALAGLIAYEHAYVQAAQAVPLA